jgi:hypothetical protein
MSPSQPNQLILSKLRVARLFSCHTKRTLYLCLHTGDYLKNEAKYSDFEEDVVFLNLKTSMNYTNNYVSLSLHLHCFWMRNLCLRKEISWKKQRQPKKYVFNSKKWTTSEKLKIFINYYSWNATMHLNFMCMLNYFYFVNKLKIFYSLCHFFPLKIPYFILKFNMNNLLNSTCFAIVISQLNRTETATTVKPYSIPYCQTPPPLTYMPAYRGHVRVSRNTEVKTWSP